MPAVPESPPIDHLILPYASTGTPEQGQSPDWPELPHLAELLARLQALPADIGDEFRLSPPHERAWAAALELTPAGQTLPDGLIPWAAWSAGVRDRACAWFTPCQWNVGADQVRLQPPEALELGEDDSRALLEALSPWAAEDGITLVWETAGRWRAEGDIFEALPWASLDRVAHRRVDAWLPDSGRWPQAAGLLRLLNETQMLFYTHPVNDRRQALGRPAINGIWISGCGAWRHSTPADQAHGLELENALRPAALRGDHGEWKRTWEMLDATLIVRLLAQVQRGQPLRLTLCGERTAQTWVTPASDHPRPWWQALLPGWRARRRVPMAEVLGTL